MVTFASGCPAQSGLVEVGQEADAGNVAASRSESKGCCMGRKEDEEKERFDHAVMLGVYILGAAALVWAFITFVIMLFER